MTFQPFLLRKEVIQPLVLERLPCYDFTPVTNPTNFSGSVVILGGINFC